jgi:hypothetical protein
MNRFEQRIRITNAPRWHHPAQFPLPWWTPFGPRADPTTRPAMLHNAGTFSRPHGVIFSRLSADV